MGPNATKVLSLQLHISNVGAKDVGWYTCGVDFEIYVVTANVSFSLQEETPGGKIIDKRLSLALNSPLPIYTSTPPPNISTVTHASTGVLPSFSLA